MQFSQFLLALLLSGVAGLLTAPRAHRGARVAPRMLAAAAPPAQNDVAVILLAGGTGSRMKVRAARSMNLRLPPRST